jgi:VanZ family protein
MSLIDSRWFRVAGWLCIGLLAVLSLIPSTAQVRTGLPGGYEHAVAYFGTASIFMLGYRRRSIPIAAGLVAYGSLLEFLQFLSPGRMPHIADAGASGAGAVLGVVLWTLLLDRCRRVPDPDRREVIEKS